MSNIQMAKLLVDVCSVPQLQRLCVLGSFTIRNVDPWWDTKSYNRERKRVQQWYTKEVDVVDSFVKAHCSSSWFLHGENMGAKKAMRSLLECFSDSSCQKTQ